MSDRLLLTGHSHQAWPDVARDALLEAFDDAAHYVDRKWTRAFEKAERVRAGFRQLLDDTSGEIALTASTHDALLRFLSALPLKDRPRLVTSDAEFFTVQRQLTRLEEEGIAITRVAARPVATLVPRLCAVLSKHQNTTSAVLVSSVLFDGGEIVPELSDLARNCARFGVELFIDAYHHLNVVPFSVQKDGLEASFITGGGYKYCQLGEGNCFLRFPKHCQLRPVITGWFANFAELESEPNSAKLAYGPGAARFAGATYDPTSHYRAARVFEFFSEQQLDIVLLRQVSQHQIARLRTAFSALELDPKLIDFERSLSVAHIAGFVAFRSPKAAQFVAALAERGVSSDARDSILRLGPAPYLSDAQLDDAIAALDDAARKLTGES